MNGRIHFIGICGVAMSALAAAFHKEGWQVSGSDVGFFPPISDYLKDNKISFYPGWHADRALQSFSGGGKNDEIVVVGNVAGSTNAEFLYARKNNLNYKSYPEVIAEYIVQKNSLVCAGTYGKTSTAALLTLILTNAGLDPTYMFGGLSANLPVSARINGVDDEMIKVVKLNKRSDSPVSTNVATRQFNHSNSGWSVLEGDEYKTSRWDSRPKFKLYSPTHLLLTSVSWDHADIYPTEETYFQAFKDLTAMIPADGLIVACADAANINKIISANTNGTKIIKYGKDQSADYVYYDVAQTNQGISFKIKSGGEEYNISTPILGEHMAENICGCFAMARELGVEEKIILDTIAEFKGIKRRLEKRFEPQGGPFGSRITVYDDLGHSPAKAAASLRTLRAIYPNSKITAIFEPNTGNRKLQSAPSYAHAFRDADEVIIPMLTKIKTDPNDPDPPFDGVKLTEIISQTHPRAVFINNDDKLIEHLKNNLKEDGVVVFLGSHGFRGMIERLIAHNT